MLAKQYTIRLPADYDMDIIRRRVADAGPRFDGFPGLAFKAFLLGERSYAPFYLWNDTAGANEFLSGPGFAGLEASFGRPRIEHWLVIGSRLASDARFAARSDIAIREGEPLDSVYERERDWLAGRGQAVVGLDPSRWSIVRFELSRDPLDGDVRYRVLHLSRGTPG